MPGKFDLFKRKFRRFSADHFPGLGNGKLMVSRLLCRGVYQPKWWMDWIIRTGRPLSPTVLYFDPENSSKILFIWGTFFRAGVPRTQDRIQVVLPSFFTRENFSVDWIGKMGRSLGPGSNFHIIYGKIRFMLFIKQRFFAVVRARVIDSGDPARELPICRESSGTNDCQASARGPRPPPGIPPRV